MTKVKFYWGKSERNSHGTQGKGEKWNQQSRTGPKFLHNKLDVHAPSTGHRFIFYFPSGAWWHWDVYFDRRAPVTAAEAKEEDLIMSVPTYYGQLQRRIADERNDRLQDSVQRQPHCNYKPHAVECAKYAGHKIIETDTGKEFYCCSEHLKNYQQYNERANREVFVIVF